MILGNRMKKKVDEREQYTIPTYTLEKKRRKIPLPALILFAVALVIFVVIYLPPLIISEPDTSVRLSVDMTPYADPNAMEWAQKYLRNNPDADFDGDGLTNEQEIDCGTGVYLIDNDGDGTTDYAELYYTETNPKYYDNAIQNFVQQSDARTGSTVNTPYKVHDVVLWADDYEAKSRGSVVPLADGSYNFYLFKGWVQFPGSVEYAYKVAYGRQTPLAKNEAGYFYIDSKELTNVRVYAKEPERCYVVSLLNTDYKMSDNIGSRILCALLPSKGFGLITVKPALCNDLDGTWDEVAIVNDIVTLRLAEYADTRFGRNDLSLNDLSNIFTEIDNGRNVIIQLMSHDVGEVYLEVYGYTNRNNLLVCEPRTGDTKGVINVDVMSERVLDSSGTITLYEHYSFGGCGYASTARHRLVVVDTVDVSDFVG